MSLASAPAPAPAPAPTPAPAPAPAPELNPFGPLAHPVDDKATIAAAEAAATAANSDDFHTWVTGAVRACVSYPAYSGIMDEAAE